MFERVTKYRNKLVSLRVRRKENQEEENKEEGEG